MTYPNEGVRSGLHAAVRDVRQTFGEIEKSLTPGGDIGATVRGFYKLGPQLVELGRRLQDLDGANTGDR